MNGLGRIPEFDIRSRGYPIRTLIGDALPLVSRMWSCEDFLDQGSEGACVGFSWTHDIAAEPVVGVVNTELAFLIYYSAQKIDQWPGEDYDGTSVIAGAKVVHDLGWISEYRWAFGLDDALAAVSHVGPVILGVNWYTGMWDTDDDGYLYVSGHVAGGHAILMVGIDLDRRAVRLHNSWGPSWGDNGGAWLSFEDLGRLLEESGEACIPLVRVNPIPEPEPEPIPEPEPEPTPEPDDPSEPEPKPPPAPKGCLSALIGSWWFK